MQGYDSFQLDTDIQLGGTDQTFNMQAGRTLLWNLKQKESFVMANGFLPGTDGRKMSKTWNNAIWLEDTPEEIYGKVMSTADDLLVTYFEMGTNVEMTKIAEVKERLGSGENPMNIKKELAKIIVAELCGEDKVAQAEEYFRKTVVEKTAGEDTPEVVLGAKLLVLGAERDLGKILIENGLVSSASEFKRLLDEGAIYKDEVRLNRDSVIDTIGTVRIGKRKYLKLV
jgi:tyrosyl-tRNA synthetase